MECVCSIHVETVLGLLAAEILAIFHIVECAQRAGREVSACSGVRLIVIAKLLNKGFK